jgi:iron(III) transport system substrate-binding protein
MHSSVRTLAVAAASLLTAGIVLAACGGDDGGESSADLVVYSGRTEDLIKPILDRFSEESGIDVEVRYGNTADLALLIDEEGDKSPADVFLSQSPGAVGYLDQKDRLGSLPADVLSLVQPGFQAEDGSWVAFSARKRVLAYNPETTDEASLPASVLDLVDPEWKGRIGIAPSNASFQDFVTAMRMQIGDEATSEWLRGIAANDPFTFSGNSAVLEAIARGEVEVGLINHYYRYQALAEDPNTPVVNYDFPPDDIGSLVIVTGATVIKGTEQPEEAAELVRFLLSPEAQTYFTDETFEYPLAAGATPNAVLPPVDLTASPAIDFEQLGGDLETTRTMIRDAGLEG